METYVHLQALSNPSLCFHSLEAAFPTIRSPASAHQKQCKQWIEQSV